MNYSKDLLIFQSILFSIYSVYSIYKQNQRIKEIENDINTILKIRVEQKREHDEFKRKRKVEEQLKRVIDKEDIPQTKFWDDDE